MKRSTLRWFSHIERMEIEEFVKKVYLSSVEGPGKKRRPLRSWENRVKDYMSKRGVRGNGLEQTRRECVAKERWRFFCYGHPLRGHFRRQRGISAIELI